MFVSAIKVAILAISGHEPFPNHCAEPVNQEFFTDFDQFIRAKADVYIDCAFYPDDRRISQLALLLPNPVLVNAVSSAPGELPPAFIRFNGWPGFGAGQVLEISASGNEIPDLLLQFAMACGLTCIEVPGQPGLVRPRIVAMIINEAYYALGEGVSTPGEIDIAMKLGTSYPFGPFEWSETIGLQRILGLLEILAVNDKKYAPAASLVAAVQQQLWQKS